jgi:NADH:ubiquinone oxidoreductase subunit 5 (subunit L)/multisubunit Na+/H+ antiporter MnhA subunit
MMVSVALGAEASMCHLMTHASFKAALFLAAGVVIQAGNQHMQRERQRSVPAFIGLLTLLVGSLSLVGWPEISGFYSKETILNLALVFFHPASDLAHTLLLLTALLTSLYTCKLCFYCFVQSVSFPPVVASRGHSYLVLLFDIVMKVWVAAGVVGFSWGVKTMPLGVVLAGIMCAAAVVASQRFALIRFGGTRWGFDQMYARSLVSLLIDWGRLTWGAGDRGLFTVGELRAQ